MGRQLLLYTLQGVVLVRQSKGSGFASHLGYLLEVLGVKSDQSKTKIRPKAVVNFACTAKLCISILALIVAHLNNHVVSMYVHKD